MYMHAPTVVAENRFWHEGRRLAVAMRHLMDPVFENLQMVGDGGHSAELDPEFMLICLRTFFEVVI